MESLPKVAITGVTGYIGSWVAKVFIESGKYTVCGTVRDQNSEKVKLMKEGLGPLAESMHLYEADLLDQTTLENAFEGCDFVIHVASVVSMSNTKDEEKILKPAVTGTENVMNACAKTGVKRVVLTSSAITVLDVNNPGKVDESNWITLDNDTPQYDKSKVLAEKKAWEIAEASGIELVTLLPGIVTGKVLFKSKFESGELIMNIMTGRYPRLAKIYMPFVDVEDVARAHLLSLNGPANERYILSEATYKINEVGIALESEFKQHGYSPTTKELNSVLAKIFSWCGVSAINRFYHFWNVFIDADNTKSIEKLEIGKYKSMKESVIEQGWSFIDLGMIRDKRK